MLDFKATGKLSADAAELEYARKDFASACATEKHQMDTMKLYDRDFGYVCCPHTACGVSACDQLRDCLQWAQEPNHTMVVLGTAHPAKFSDAVEQAIGRPPVMPQALADCQNAPTRLEVKPNSLQAVKKHVERTVACRESLAKTGCR